MSNDAPKTTYVIGRVDSNLAELQALLDWIEQDATSRSAKARVVFLGSIVGGIYTRAVVREVLQTLERFPGSILISGRKERNLLDFLEDNWTRQPVLDWMSHLGGNDILKSFGICTETTKIADGRRTIIHQIPKLLELLRQAKEYEVEDGISPNATGWVSALAIDDGRAARFVLAHRQVRDMPIQLEVLPFDRRLAEDPDRWLAVGKDYNWAAEESAVVA